VVTGQILDLPLLLLAGEDCPSVTYVGTEQVVVLQQDAVECGATLAFVHLFVFLEVLVQSLEQVEQHVACTVSEPDFISFYDFSQIMHEKIAYVFTSYAVTVGN